MGRPRPLHAAPELAELVGAVLVRGGHVWLVASGESMLPALRPGDELLFGPLREGEPRLGQVVLWQRGGKLIAHRVVELRADGLVTAGDASVRADPAISRDALVGVLRKHLRPLRIRLGLALLPVRRLFSQA